MSRGADHLSYCNGPLKRVTDLSASALGLVLLSPLFALLAVMVLLSMGRPVFFVQDRIGRVGKRFRLLKFRTMISGAGGLVITGSGDRRVTPLGRILRAVKLDELPQLLNVLRGDMSLVGPRPEVPRYVANYTLEQRRVLDVRPGLTDPASVLFRDEEDLLGAVAEEKRESYYLAEVMPHKLRLNLEYIARAGFFYDLALILRTLLAIVLPPGPGR